MPPRGVTSPKRKRQYEHIKESEASRGVGEDRAEEIAARTVNKQRAEAGETKASGRTSGRKSGKKGAAPARKTSGAKKAAGGRKAAAGGRKSAGKRAAKKR